MTEGLNAAEIESVWKKSRENHLAEVRKLDGDPNHIKRIFRPGGIMEVLESYPQNRRIRVLTVADLIAQANKPFDSRMASDAKKRLITVCSDNVYLFYNTEKGLEWAVLALVQSEEYGFFAERCSEPMIGVKEFRTALKYQIRSTFGEDTLIEQIGDIGFGNQAGNNQAASRGSESLGKSIVAEANSESSAGLPDERMTFSVRMWQNADLDARFPIECQLDPDPQSQRWICYPNRDSMANFVSVNTDMVAKRIAQEVKDVQILQGDLDLVD